MIPSVGRERRSSMHPSQRRQIRAITQTQRLLLYHPRNISSPLKFPCVLQVWHDGFIVDAALKIRQQGICIGKRIYPPGQNKRFWKWIFLNAKTEICSWSFHDIYAGICTVEKENVKNFKHSIREYLLSIIIMLYYVINNINIPFYVVCCWCRYLYLWYYWIFNFILSVRSVS